MFPKRNTSYQNLTKEDYLRRLLDSTNIFLGQNCCFSVVNNIQLSYTGEAKLDDTLIGPMTLTYDNMFSWHSQLNDTISSLGYDDITELLVDRGWEKVDTPQIMDISWCQLDNDLATLTPNAPFDKQRCTNLYIYNGTYWLEKTINYWEIVREHKIESITSNGIFRMVTP